MNQQQHKKNDKEFTNDKPSPLPSGRERFSSKRFETFKGRQGATVDNDVKRALFDKLLHGFKDISEVMSSMHVSTTTCAIHLPISTRAIGFTVRYLIRKFARLNIRGIDFHPLCCALYRISLLLYEIKITNARSQAAFRNAPHGFENFDVDTEIIRVIGQLGAGFAPLVNLISSIGVLHAFNTTFIPRHPVATAINAVRQIEPSMITHSNLRDTVVAMANAATNRDTRMWFYNHNPLPNARWSERNRRRDADGEPAVDPNFPLLLNADEIVPAIYEAAQIREDVAMIQDSLEMIGRKYPKYVHVGRIDFSGSGNYSMLVSNEQSDLRCSDLVWQQRANEWVTEYGTSTECLEGGDQTFWSLDKLADPEFYSGVLHLLGELPQIPPETFSVRSKYAKKQDASHTFADALGNLVG